MAATYTLFKAQEGLYRAAAPYEAVCERLLSWHVAFQRWVGPLHGLQTCVLTQMDGRLAEVPLSFANQDAQTLLEALVDLSGIAGRFLVPYPSDSGTLRLCDTLQVRPFQPSDVLLWPEAAKSDGFSAYHLAVEADHDLPPLILSKRHMFASGLALTYTAPTPFPSNSVLMKPVVRALIAYRHGLGIFDSLHDSSRERGLRLLALLCAPFDAEPIHIVQKRLSPRVQSLSPRGVTRKDAVSYVAGLSMTCCALAATSVNRLAVLLLALLSVEQSVFQDIASIVLSVVVLSEARMFPIFMALAASLNDFNAIRWTLTRVRHNANLPVSKTSEMETLLTADDEIDVARAFEQTIGREVWRQGLASALVHAFIHGQKAVSDQLYALFPSSMAQLDRLSVALDRLSDADSSSSISSSSSDVILTGASPFASQQATRKRRQST